MTEDQKQKRRPRRKRGRLILALIVLIIVAALALGLGLKVQGYPHGYGNVTARKDPLLRARQKGPIGRILVQHDQHVSKGQLILQLDDSLAKVTLERSQTAVNEAASEIEVFRAKCILTAAQREYQRNLAKLQIEAAKHKLDQLLAGRDKGTVSTIEVQEAQLAYDMVLLQPEHIYKAEQELEKKELVSLEQQLLAARAQVELREQQLAGLDVRSPIDGRVVLNPLVVGEVVDANKILGRVFDETSFTIEARFPERLLYFIKVGQEADVWPMGRSRWADPLKGKILEVGRLVQPQDTGDGYFWITVTVDQQSLQLYPGQNAKVAVYVRKVSLFRSILGL